MWAISVDVLLLSLPFVALGLWSVLTTWQNTRNLFRVDLIHCALGLFGVVPTVFVLFLFRSNVESAFSYTMIFHEGLTATGSLAVTFIATAVWCGITTAFLSLYVFSVVAEGTGRYDRQPGETDGIGRLIQEMRLRAG
jgi:hypothetical protein